MKRNILYILFGALTLVACSGSDLSDCGTLSPTGEKTPLAVKAVLAIPNTSVTRAADKDFANGDQLLAYLRHVTWDGQNTDARTAVTTDKSPLLVTLTKGSAAMNAYTGGDITPIGTYSTGNSSGTALAMNSSNTSQTSDLTASPTLYWDDFSQSTADGSLDLRTASHYLESYYGYCYNGGTPSKKLAKETGVLGWSVQTDQTTAEAFQHSDILWSAEQTPVSYTHGTTSNGSRPGLILPYTHAMSKVTINLTAGEGFADDFKFTGTGITLKAKNTTCSLTAPTMSMNDKGTPEDIQMLPYKTDVAKQATYTAIIVPSKLTKDAVFATITNADGNTYTINVTDAMLATASTANGNKGWGEKLSGGEMQSGVNYELNVTLDKQKVTVVALLKDWDDVSATGTGIIRFNADVVSHDKENSLTTDGAAFDLWQAEATTTTPTYGNKVATVTYHADTKQWKSNPTLYWPNGSTSYYFRALTKKDGEKFATVSGATAATLGTDLLWATTPKHTGTEADGATQHDYAEGAAINPRTATVPLQFEHAMSKITVKLQNDPTAEAAAKVDLDKATISIDNIYDGGTINIADGKISSLTASATTPPVSGYHSADATGDGIKPLKDLAVIPQSLDKDKDGNARNAVLHITLKDGTTYSLNLDDCVTTTTSESGESTTTPVTAWERGKSYTYTISLSKEKITFRALIKAWEETTGSGNATLDWD